MIQGHGSNKPLAILIADYAQGEDLSNNRALSGYKEKMISKLCKSNGLGYEDFYKTCLIKADTKFNEDTDEKDTAALVAKYSPFLIQEINELETNLLIPMGEIGFNYLTGLTGIRKFRGSVLQASLTLGINREIKVLPVLGPYPYLYKEYELKFISRIDFGKIKSNLEPGAPSEKFTNLWVARSPGALREFLNRSYSEDAILNFDIETYLGIPTCISLCFDGNESICVPLLDSTIDTDTRTLLWQMVAKLLNSPIKKINQNIKYDWKILERWGFKVNNIFGDTQIAASVLMCELKKNLGFLTSIYTDLPYFKDEGKEWDPSKYNRERFYMYNAKDSLAAWRIHKIQSDEIEQQGATKVYKQLIHALTVYKRLEERGILIDDEARQELLIKYESLYRIHSMKLEELSEIVNINPLSHVVANRLIFDKLGFNRTMRGVNNSTGEDALMLLMAYGEAKTSPVFGKQILQTLIDCRKLHKVIEILQMPLYPDSRLRGEYNLGGTETGRTSCSGSLDELLVVNKKGFIEKERLGHSLQTIGKHGFMIDGETYGKDIRQIFVPSPGFEFVEIDLSQAEARVDTVLAGNFELLKIFDSKIGIHRLTGSWVYACAPEEITKNILINGIDRYHMSKQVRHAGERNIGPSGLYSLTQRPIKECMALLKTFHEYQPEIREVFHHDISVAVNETRLLIAPNGRFRQFLSRIDNRAINEAISFLPQAIVSDQTKFAMAEAADLCKEFAYPLMEAHDGTLWEVKKGYRQQLLKAYKRLVERPIDFNTCTLKRDIQLVIPCEAEFSAENWNELKGVEIDE